MEIPGMDEAYPQARASLALFDYEAVSTFPHTFILRFDLALEPFRTLGSNFVPG